MRPIGRTTQIQIVGGYLNKLTNNKEYNLS